MHAGWREQFSDANEAKRLLMDKPRFSYVVQEHQRSHGIPYNVARKDVLQMSDIVELLVKTKQGKQYYFVVANELEERIAFA